MMPVGWEALGHWGDDAARIESLAGGVANDVWSVRVDGRLAVGRLSARSDADLAWETNLLQHLDDVGLAVPVPIPTTGGRLFADGLVVMTYVEGAPPDTEADWRRVPSASRAASVDAGMAAASGLAILGRSRARRCRDEDRPAGDAARRRCSMPSSVDACWLDARNASSTATQIPATSA